MALIDFDIYNFDEFEIFHWDDNLLIHHEEIDNQHRSLVALLNRLARAMVNNNDGHIEKAFGELVDYADYHFKTEDAYWAEHMGDDDWVKAHHKVHDSLLPQLMEMRKKGEDREKDDLMEELVSFLIRWLAYHIIDNDKRMSLAVSEIIKGKSNEEAKAFSRDKMNGSLQTLTETILKMYDGLSSNTIHLMKERRLRLQLEEALCAANEDLERLAITDTLTGLFNRRHFNDLGHQEFKRAARDHVSLGFIEIDIDFFKTVNDTKGHQEGDRILERLVSTADKMLYKAKETGRNKTVVF
ncbi:MAG: bacteriohemerythrin [Spirochaetales bacterium]|nr:bacteriohemerythrin [Spirochaetales bacterium]